MESTYTLHGVDKDNGSVSVSFSVDKKKQNISSMPVHDAKALDEALVEYGNAYESGLKKEKIVVDDEVSKMIGKEKELNNSGEAVTE